MARSSNLDVTFNNGTSGTTYGTLVLGDPLAFSDQISGFSGTQPDLIHSDTVDLDGFNYTSTTFSESSSNGNLVLTATDGSNIATLTFDNFDGTLNFASDHTGGTLITDPAAASPATAEGAISFAGAEPANALSASFTPKGSGYGGSFSLDPVSASNGRASVGWEFSLGNDQIKLAAGQTETQTYEVSVSDGQNAVANQTVSISIGGPGHDNFIFQPGIGADTVVDFDPQADTIELDNFASIQSVQQLASLISLDAHGDAVIDLGHGDNITLPGMNAVQLQAVLQSVVHLH